MRYATSSIPGCDPCKQQAARLQEALARGFVHVESGPLVRSSYHAADGPATLLQASARLATATAFETSR